MGPQKTKGNNNPLKHPTRVNKVETGRHQSQLLLCFDAKNNFYISGFIIYPKIETFAANFSIWEQSSSKDEIFKGFSRAH